MNWYSVDKNGAARLCKGKDDAEEVTMVSNRFLPMDAPHRAVQLVDAQEIDALKARIAELEAEMEAVGAGGVQPMRGDALTPGEPVVRWDSDGWGELMVDSLPDGALLYTAPPAQTPPPRLVNECLRKDALTAIRALREWIDAVPKDTPLPAMPGIDGDWLDGVEVALADQTPPPRLTVSERQRIFSLAGKVLREKEDSSTWFVLVNETELLIRAKLGIKDQEGGAA